MNWRGDGDDGERTAGTVPEPEGRDPGATVQAGTSGGGRQSGRE